MSKIFVSKPTPQSRIVLGGAFGERTDSLSSEILIEFASAGGRFIETAASYADGDGERQVGRVLGELPRELTSGIRVITKIGHGADGTNANLSLESLREEIIQSIERLGRGALDVVMLHRDENDRDTAEIAESMGGFIRDGLIKSYGLSNFTLKRCLNIQAAAETNGYASPTVLSQQYSLAKPLPSRLWPGSLSADQLSLIHI